MKTLLAYKLVSENVGNIDLATIKIGFIQSKTNRYYLIVPFFGILLVFYVIYILSRKTHYFALLMWFCFLCFSIINQAEFILDC